VKCRHSIFIKELILKLFIKFKFKPNKQTRRKQANKKEKKRGVTARQTR
jgi:hypothetical protein